MSLNMMGLGFSFGAKDLKLKDFQASVSEGFLDMADKAAKAVESVKPFVPSFEGVVPQIDAASDAMGDFESKAVEAIGSAGEVFQGIGKQLRQDVAEGFERAAGAARSLYQQTGIDQVSMALGDLKDRATESGTALYEAADAAFGISKAVAPIRAVAMGAWDAAKGFMGLGAAAEAANRAAMAINPEESVQGIQGVDNAVKATTSTFDHDLPVAMEKGSGSFHKEATRILVDSEHMSKMFGKIKDAGDSLKQLVSLSKLQTVFQGIGTGLLSQLSRMGSGMGSLLHAQVNLTTSLEAEGVQLAKSAKSTAAQMGYTGKEMKKVTAQAAGLASGLNIGADVAVKAIYNFNWAQKEFQALGIKTASQAAKMAESLGMDPQALAGALRKATQQFGMTADQAAQLTSSLREMGADGGVASEMVMQLGDVLDSASGATDQFGELLKGDALQQYAMGIVTAGAGLYTFTQDSKQAMDISKSLAKRMQEAGDEWNSMMSGAGGSFPEMNKMMMRFGLNVDDTFKMMASSPDGLVRGLAQLQKGMKDSGMTQQEYMTEVGRLRPYLTKALGDKAAADLVLRMGQNWEASGDAMLATMDRVRGAKADFGKLADEAHSTGRTLQEEFDRMKEAGVMGFRAIGREAAVSFVKDTGEAFKQFNKQLKTVAKKGGFLGSIVTKLSEMHQIGAYALIPKTLRPMAVLFGEISSQVLPLVGSLAPLVGGLAPLFVGMGGPMMAVTAAAGLMIVPLTLVGLRLGQLMMEGKTFSQALDQLGKDIQSFANTALDKLGKGVDYVYNQFNKVDWKALFGKIFTAIKAVFTGDFDLLGSLFGKDQAGAAKGKIASISSKITGMVGQLKDAFIGAVKEADWGAIGMGLLDKLVFVFIELPNRLFRHVMSLDFAGVLKGLIENLSASFAAGGAGAGIGDILVRAFSGLAETATRIYQVMWKVLTTAFELLATVDWSSVAANLWTGLKGAFEGGGTAVAGLGAGIWSAIKGAFDWVLSKGPEVAAWLAESIPTWVDMAVGAMKFGETSFTQAQDWVFGLVETLGGYIKTGLEYLWDEVPGWLGSVADWFAGLDWVGMGVKLVKGILELGTTLQARMVGLPPTILGWLVDGLTWVLDKIPPALDKYVPIALKWFDNLPKMIEDMLSGNAGGDAAGGFIGGLFGKFGDAFGKYWPVLKKIVLQLIPSLASALWTVVSTLVPALGSMLLKLVPTLYNILGTVWLKLMDTARDFVVGLVDGIKNYLMAKFPSVAGPIAVVFEGIKIVVMGAFEVFKWFWWGVIKGFEYLWKGIGWVLGALWDGLKWVGGAIVWLGEGAWEAVKAIGSAFEWVWDTVSAVFTWIADAVTKVWKVAKVIFEVLGDIGAAAFDVLWSAAEPVLEWIGEVFQETFDWIQAKVVAPVVAWIVDKFMWIWGKAKSIFEGIYKTVADVFQRVYDKVAMVFVGIQNMWDKSWTELKRIMDSWFTWVNDKVELVKAKLVEVFEGLKTKAEAAMESLKAVLEKPFNILKDTLGDIWNFAADLFKKLWGGIVVIVNAAKAAILGLFSYILDALKTKFLDPLVAAAKAVGLDGLIPAGLVEAVEKSAAKAGQAMTNFSLTARDGVSKIDDEIQKTFVTNTLHHDVEKSAGLATEYMNAFAKASAGDVGLVGDTASKVFGDMADAEMTPELASDVLAMALVQPFMQGADAANYYASVAMKAFEKVVFGAQSMQEAMQLTPAELNAAVRLAPQMAATEAPTNRMEARQRELQVLAQGPMRELLQATHNPQWYNDWRSTFLKAHEELKEEIRALRDSESKTQPNAQARPMPARDILGEYGFNYNRVGV